LHLPEGTRLPPALALAAAALGARTPEQGVALLRAAGELTAREARACGIELVLAPVADVNTARDNPIIAVRSFGDDPVRAGRMARAWLEGLRAGGAAGTAKHFPGHGDTSQDSHIELALVLRDERGLREIELVPFRELCHAGVETVMIGHLDVPAMTGERGLPTTLSPRAIHGVLREELGFKGTVLSDAMNMGALAKEPRRYARALAAGCDGLLCPHDPQAAAEELLEALQRGDLSRERLAQAAQGLRGLRDGLRARSMTPRPLHSAVGEHTPTEARQNFATDLAAAGLVASKTRWPWRRGKPCEVGMSEPEVLSVEARRQISLMREALAVESSPAGVVLPVICEVRAFQGGYGLLESETQRLLERIADLRRLGWPVGLAWFGSPQTLPRALWEDPELAILLAHAPTPPMFAAVRAWLEGRVEAGGSLPAELG
jgi:beta-glucosidase-like glycosyl hydrolase